MSSRAMASQRNKRTTNGVQTSQPPQPQNKTMSSSQRMSQIQGTMPRQNISTPSRFSNKGSSLTPESYASQPPPQLERNYERENTRRELSIPEAFAMLNQKVTNIEEILSDNGVQFETHTPSVNKDEIIGGIQGELDDTVTNLKFVQEHYHILFSDIAILKTALSEKDEILKNHSDSILKLEDQINNYLKTSEDSVDVETQFDNEEKEDEEIENKEKEDEEIENKEKEDEEIENKEKEDEVEEDVEKTDTQEEQEVEDKEKEDEEKNIELEVKEK